MQYRKDKNGENLSLLGYGCMRFTRKNGSIDMEKAEKEIMLAYSLGVNYYDTAYIYPGSEAALGCILEKNGIRDKVHIATKLPHYLIKSREGMERLFSEQLRRLRTDYIDYYLMHILTDVSTWDKLRAIGAADWLEEKKRQGKIRDVGFSFHGNSDTFIKLVDAYDWDFCQIQYNYVDEHTQAGRKGLMYASEKGLPVIIMEPLRGGRLVSLLPDGAKKIIAESGATAASYALRWLYDQKEVTVVLSGMNSLDMIKENAHLASVSPAGCMTGGDRLVIELIKTEIGKSLKVGCTGCGYCMPCPHGVDIPEAFSCYNKMYAESPKSARKEYLQCTAMRKSPSSASMCIGCGKCETRCPQGIRIRRNLKKAVKELETPLYKLVRAGVKVLNLW